jgi:hypothetical protein
MLAPQEYGNPLARSRHEVAQPIWALAIPGGHAIQRIGIAITTVIKTRNPVRP